MLEADKIYIVECVKDEFFVCNLTLDLRELFEDLRQILCKVTGFGVEVLLDELKCFAFCKILTVKHVHELVDEVVSGHRILNIHDLKVEGEVILMRSVEEEVLEVFECDLRVCHLFFTGEVHEFLLPCSNSRFISLFLLGNSSNTLVVLSFDFVDDSFEFSKRRLEVVVLCTVHGICPCTEVESLCKLGILVVTEDERTHRIGIGIVEVVEHDSEVIVVDDAVTGGTRQCITVEEDDVVRIGEGILAAVEAVTPGNGEGVMTGSVGESGLGSDIGNLGGVVVVTPEAVIDSIEIIDLLEKRILGCRSCSNCLVVCFLGIVNFVVLRCENSFVCIIGCGVSCILGCQCLSLDIVEERRILIDRVDSISVDEHIAFIKVGSPVPDKIESKGLDDVSVDKRLVSCHVSVCSRSEGGYGRLNL